jgi:hypothetical protein
MFVVPGNWAMMVGSSTEPSSSTDTWRLGMFQKVAVVSGAFRRFQGISEGLIKFINWESFGFLRATLHRLASLLPAYQNEVTHP